MKLMLSIVHTSKTIQFEILLLFTCLVTITTKYCKVLGIGHTNDWKLLVGPILIKLEYFLVLGDTDTKILISLTPTC